MLPWNAPFQIRLPDSAVDQSTYMFLLPDDTSGKSSLVLKVDRTPSPSDPLDYMHKQLRELRVEAETFAQFHPEACEHAGFASARVIVDWNFKGRGMVRQLQLYVCVPKPLRMYSLFATSPREEFDARRAGFEEIIRSFRPVSG